MSHVLYQFSGNHLGAIEWCEPRRGETLVADSWRVDDGQVVALAHHLDRFRTSVAVDDSAARAPPVEAFLAAVLHKIQPVGSWFPRIEAVATPGGPTLRYRHRVAPEPHQRGNSRVHRTGPPDPPTGQRTRSRSSAQATKPRGTPRCHRSRHS